MPFLAGYSLFHAPQAAVDDTITRATEGWQLAIASSPPSLSSSPPARRFHTISPLTQQFSSSASHFQRISPNMPRTYIARHCCRMSTSRSKEAHAHEHTATQRTTTPRRLIVATHASRARRKKRACYMLVEMLHLRYFRFSPGAYSACCVTPSGHARIDMLTCKSILSFHKHERVSSLTIPLGGWY